MAATTTDQKDTFVTVPGDRHSEVARTLAEPVPQALSLLDQFGLWGNLGVSLLGFTGAIFVLQPGGPGTPELSLAAALTAIVAGTVLGTAVLASRRPPARARHGGAHAQRDQQHRQGEAATGNDSCHAGPPRCLRQVVPDAACYRVPVRR